MPFWKLSEAQPCRPQRDFDHSWSGGKIFWIFRSLHGPGLLGPVARRLLSNQRLLESTQVDCHFALANRSLTDQEQTLVLQQLTLFQKDFATLRLH